MNDDEALLVSMIGEMVGLVGPVLDKARTAGLVDADVEARLAGLHTRLFEFVKRL